MKKFLKVLKYIALFLLFILSSVNLTIYTVFKTTEKFISKDNIINIVKKIDVKDLLGDDVTNKMYEVLDKTGMPREYADYVLESEEVKEVFSNYVAEGMEYIVFDKEAPKLDKDQLSTTLIDTFNTAVKEAEANNIEVDKYLTVEEQEQVKGQIETYTEEFVEKIPDMESIIEEKVKGNDKLNSELEEIENTKKEIQDAIDEMQRFMKYRIIALISLIVELGLMIALSYKKLRFFKFLAVPFGVVGGCLMGLSVLTKVVVKGDFPKDLERIRAFIEETISSLRKIWMNISIVYLIVFALLIVTQIVVHIIYNRRENKAIKNL